MLKLKLLVLGLLFVVGAAAPVEDRNFEVKSSYNKVDDTTTVSATFLLPKSAGIQDSLSLWYSFPGKKQTDYVAPTWTLSLYDRNQSGTDPQTVKILINDKGPAERLELRFVEHDAQFGGDRFDAELQIEMERTLMNAKTLEVFPPTGETAGTCKLNPVQTNKLRSFLRTAGAKRGKGDGKG